MGYTFTKSSHTCNHLQYANDTCLIGDGPASCQALLEMTEKWLQWARLKARIPKCASLVFQASTGKGYDPSLTLQGDTIPFIGESTFHSLGHPLPSLTPQQSREALCCPSWKQCSRRSTRPSRLVSRSYTCIAMESAHTWSGISPSQNFPSPG